MKRSGDLSSTFSFSYFSRSGVEITKTQIVIGQIKAQVFIGHAR